MPSSSIEKIRPTFRKTFVEEEDLWKNYLFTIGMFSWVSFMQYLGIHPCRRIRSNFWKRNTLFLAIVWSFLSLRKGNRGKNREHRRTFANKYRNPGSHFFGWSNLIIFWGCSLASAWKILHFRTSTLDPVLWLSPWILDRPGGKKEGVLT